MTTPRVVEVDDEIGDRSRALDVSRESVPRWMRQADVEDGIKDGLASVKRAEVVYPTPPD